MSHCSQAVYEFTSKTNNCPAKPERPLNKQELDFLVKMVVSEIVELCQTTYTDHEQIRKLINSGIDTDLSDYQHPTDTSQVIADQADAVVDAWYYCLDAFCKIGVNLDQVFDEVHQANMNKFANGVNRRSDGKIIKPKNWQPPNIHAIIIGQQQNGAWKTPVVPEE